MSINRACHPLLVSQRGISLIELIMFIVIIGVGVTGILLVMNQTVMHSADPLLRKQALAIAESLLEEVELMPSTYCDPDDPNAGTAVAAANCTGGAGGPNDESAALGPEGAGSVGGAEGRYAVPQFDNVNDYHGFNMAGIRDLANGLVAGLGGYSASVTVGNAAFGGIPASESLLISVTVTPPNGDAVVMQGYRTRYSPRI